MVIQKDPGVGMVLSAVIPGGGQLYAESFGGALLTWLGYAVGLVVLMLPVPLLVLRLVLGIGILLLVVIVSILAAKALCKEFNLKHRESGDLLREAGRFEDVSCYSCGSIERVASVATAHKCSACGTVSALVRQQQTAQFESA